MAPVDKNTKTKDFSTQNSTVSVNKADLGSPSGRILLGFLDVIRRGIQKFRALKILEELETSVCDYLKVDMTYYYVPSKIEKTKSEKTIITVKRENSNIKIKTEIKTETAADINDNTVTENREENDDENENETENEEGAMNEASSSNCEKTAIKVEKCSEEETKKAEEDEKKKLQRLRKEELEIIQEKKRIFLRRVLSSDEAILFVTLPDCHVLITATPRYGFELKSVVCGEDPNPFVHFLQNENKNHSHNQSKNVPSSASSSTVNTHKPSNKSDTKALLTTSRKYSPCDSLFHPMAIRLDLTQQLLASMKSVILGSHLRYCCSCSVSECAMLYCDSLCCAVFGAVHHCTVP